jgi:hypothetical protein
MQGIPMTEIDHEKRNLLTKVRKRRKSPKPKLLAPRSLVSESEILRDWMPSRSAVPANESVPRKSTGEQ